MSFGHRERALSEWQRRLGRQLRTNLVGDLVAQVFILGAFYFYSSPWVILLWIIRWFVIGAIRIGLSRVGSPDPAGPLFVVVLGHLIGAVIVTIIAPEFGAITVLIVIADLQMASDYLPPGSHLTYRWFAALMVGVLSLLTLQSWTRVGEEAPDWLLLVFLVGHGCGVSLLIAQQTWQSISLARERGQALVLSRQRLQLAADEARRDLSETIRAGPRRQLLTVRDLLAELGDGDDAPMDPVLVAEALSMSESAIQSLRDVGHGMYSSGLTSSDLSVVLASLRWEQSPNLHISSILDPPLPTRLLESVIEIAADVAGWAQRSKASAEFIVADRTPTGVSVVFTLVCMLGAHDLSDLGRRLADLAGAAGGEVQLLERERRLLIIVKLAEVPTGVQDGVPTQGHSKTAALRPYLRGSLALSIAGLVLIAAVYVWEPASGLLELGAIVALVTGLLALAIRELRERRALRALTLTAVASTVAACGLIILLPDTAPMLVVFTALPLIVSPSITTNSQFAALIVLQQLTAAFILIMQLHEPTSVLSAVLPVWMIAAVLFVVPVAVSVLLIRVYSATKASLDWDNRLLQASRASIVTTARARRQELERDLHDGAQQLVVALAVQLRVLLRRLGHDAAAARKMIPQLTELVIEADRGLADFSAGSYPTILVDEGLRAAVYRLAAMCPYPTTVLVELSGRLPASIELTTYFCCSEALQNVAKHAGPGTAVRLVVRDAVEDLHFEVVDTGQGYDQAERVAVGRGLDNMAARVNGLLGDLVVESEVGGGCAVRGRLPIQARDADEADA